MKSYLGLSVLVSQALTIFLCHSAQEQELPRTEKLRHVYTTKLQFDDHGAPLIPISIGENLSEVVIESPTPILLLPDGPDQDGRTEIVGSRRWSITLEHSEPAQLRYAVSLARRPASALIDMKTLQKHCPGGDSRCEIDEIGTIFAVQGSVFDNRAFRLLEGPHPSLEAARQAADRYRRESAEFKRAIAVTTVEKRSAAILELTDEKSAVRLRAHDVVWFAPTVGGVLSVVINGTRRSYGGSIYVAVDARGTLSVVNTVAAEQLLKGILPAEIHAGSPINSLKAQAVAARSDLLSKLGTFHLTDPFMVCAVQHCQVYAGAGHEHSRASMAVDETRGQILVGQGGAILRARYSASCGGHSEDNDHVWPDEEPDPQLRAISDGANEKPVAGLGNDISKLTAWLDKPPRAYCQSVRFNQERFRWRSEMSAVEVARRATTLPKTGDGELGSVQELRILSRGSSGRVTQIEIVGSQSTRLVTGELPIRRFFGDLNSSLFVVTAKKDSRGKVTSFTFRGAGWGHGVGLCQTGAVGMAEQGKTYVEILKHYYQGSELKKLY